MSLRLRDAVPADVPVLLGFARDLADHEGRPAGMVTATEDAIRAGLFGAPVRAWALIAERGGGPVGGAVWSYPFRMFQGRCVLHVNIAFVAAGARGGGVGRAIFVELARRARDEGCAGLQWGVKDDNVAALAFYDRLGAERHTGGLQMGLKGEALDRLAA